MNKKSNVNLILVEQNSIIDFLKKKNYNALYRVTICSPSPKDLGYEPNEPNTMNLQRVGERAGLLANGLTASKDLKNEQTQKNTDKT